ncbi:MAG: serine/threonine-protein phosphatase [Deltaproteobacteria bacterium]|nr:serine/threonine-protein phosphatase [Deltaproteobacteria bacterium]
MNDIVEHLRDLRVCCKTDIGPKRPRNEDHYVIVKDPRDGRDTRSLGYLFAIADGMGGHPGGAEASLMACEQLVNYYYDNREIDKQDIGATVRKRLGVLEEAILKIHGDIQKYARIHKGYEGMGTTLSALVLLGSFALTAHVGDSRVYRLRGTGLEKLTEDHTMAQLSVEMGFLKQDEARDHPMSHVLMQSVGTGLEEVHTRLEKTLPGDTFLLCSDGLHGVVPDEAIKEILARNPEVEAACGRLLAEALGRGGRDNVTVMVIHV